VRSPGRRRREPAQASAARHAELSPSPTGEGLVIAVNAQGGSADDELVEALRAGLPTAEIIELDDPADLAEVLRAAAARPGTTALGVVGGDGTINAAANVAAEVGLPLVPIPGGTLNHLARDLGLAGVEEVIEAVRSGCAAGVDLPTIAGRPFLNTAAFGAYPELVAVRERYEGHLGKWPAMVLAAVKVLRRGTPIDVEVDGERQRLWMIFVGNCAYSPDGSAPSRRLRLDDGCLDIRSVDAGQPWSRTRLLLGLVTRRLDRSPVYRQWTATDLDVRSLGDPLRLACDGEVFDGGTRVLVTKDGACLSLCCAPSVIA
jgi:diacylglycerol kinase family enzyme